jgi:hypothetical protein
MTLLSVFSLVTGKWSALAGVLMLLDFAAPVIKIGWLLELTGARTSSVASELWGIVVAVFAFARAACAVAIAAKAADPVEKEVMQMPKPERTLALACLSLLGFVVVYWVLQTRRVLQKMGGAAVTVGTNRAEWIKRKQE